MSQHLILAFALAFTLSAIAQDAPSPGKPSPSSDEVRQAVERSLPYLEKEGVAWMNARKCVACHHSAFMLWSFHEARARGIAVEPQKLEDLSKQSLDLFLGNQKDLLAKKNGGVEAAHLLLSQTVATPIAAETLKTLGAILTNAQLEDGSWKYEGQGLKRSDADNNRATTRWAVLALGVAMQADPAFAEKQDLARQWLQKEESSESNEALVTRMLFENLYGDSARSKAILQELREQQNADGGWNWTNDRPSDAYATGETLYAFGRMGLTGDDQMVQRGQKYLLESQQPDGSWQSPSRKPKGGLNPIANYWGTAWATLGLLRTMSEAK